MRKILIAGTALMAIAGCSSVGGHAVGPAATHNRSSSAAPSRTPLTCPGLNPDGAVAKVVADRRRQARLEKAEGSGISRRVKDRIAWGAWSAPGTYARDLRRALADEETWADYYTPEGSHPFGSINPLWPSHPDPLSADAHDFNEAGSILNDPAMSFGASTWSSFIQAVASLAYDCHW